jgi:glycosyltransferase involved in cell wall biosynthesis
MRILHINTATSGGAAIAALRIHHGLCNQGFDSHFLSLHNSTKKIVNHHVYNGVYLSSQPKYPVLSFKNLLKEKFFKVYEKSLNKYKKNKENEIELSVPKKKNGYYTFSVFSSPFTPFDITDLEIYKQSDIIHLHWVAGFLDYESFFSKNKKPIVWTFHDMNPFMGGFHYTFDYINNKSTHFKEEEKYRTFKAELYSKVENLTIVCPSEWLQDCAKKSEIFYKKEVLSIGNAFDCGVFKLRDKKQIRNLLNLPIGKVIYLITALDLSDRRKGTHLILPIIERNDINDAIFLIVGSNFTSKVEANVINFGHVNDELLMSFLYNAADYFILTSIEDNLPNTMIESIVSGTPVIAFDISDNRKILQERGCGIISEEMSTESLYYSIEKAKSISFNQKEISKIAQELFSEENIVIKYNHLYNKAIKK